MKSLRPALLGALVLVTLCAACAPDITLGGGPSAQPVAPTLTAVVPDTGLFASQQPTVVGKPQMQIGSAYRYFDGSLLDAVPNSGPFVMGTGTQPDNPKHTVTVSDFWMNSTEISNQMYAWCVSLGKCTPPNATDDPGFSNPAAVNNPVVGVTWQQASDYCGFAHGRLPTEAEWEKAASWDGTNNLQLFYPWGNLNPSCDLLNFKNCVNHVTSVVQYGQGRSFYGLFNMEGNVFEWVGDWYQANYYSSSPAQDPTGPGTGTRRVVRSSAFDSDAAFASPSRRFSEAPGAHRNNLGFRCVVQDPAYYAPFCTLPVSYGVNASGTGTSDKPCPDPVLQHFEACTSEAKPVDLLTIFSTPPTTVTVTGMQGCTPGNNDPSVKHICPPGITVKISASCAAAPGGSPACPPYYRQDPNNPLQCIAPGRPGACPAGFQYDSSLQCCSMVAGGNAPPPLCAVGQHFFSGKCVDDATGPVQPLSITYTTGGIACQVPPATATGRAPALTTVPTSTTAPGITTVPGSTATSIVPFPTDTSAPQITPVPTEQPTQPPPQNTLPPPPSPPPPPPTPGPTGTSGQTECTLRPKDCVFGVNHQTCTCNLLP